MGNVFKGLQHIANNVWDDLTKSINVKGTMQLTGSISGQGADVDNNKQLLVNTAPLDKTIDSVTADILDGKIEAAIAITPNDTTDLATPTTYIYVGTTGDVKVDLTKGGTVTFSALQAGRFHRICAKRIYATGTAATGIIGVYHV